MTRPDRKGAGGTQRRRVAFLHTHPIQYFAPLYRFINQSADIEAVPIYMTDWSLRRHYDAGFGTSVEWGTDLLTGTQPVFLPGAQTRSLVQADRQPIPGVWQAVRHGGYDAVVLQGHLAPTNYIALAAARSCGAAVLTRSDSNPRVASSSGLRKTARRVYLSALYRILDGFLVVGTRNREFYAAMGVPEYKMFNVPFAVDNAHFLARSTLSPAEREVERRLLGIADEDPVIIYASKMQARKHADHLILAARLLVERGHKFHLLYVGSGELEPALRALAQANPKVRVHFAGFADQARIPRLLGASDIFALPAQDEPFGLIINEAMCAGLPIVTTPDVGAAADLVEAGRNGALFEVGDIKGLADALGPLIADQRYRENAGAASRAKIAQWDFAADLDGLRTALDAVAPG